MGRAQSAFCLDRRRTVRENSKGGGGYRNLGQRGKGGDKKERGEIIFLWQETCCNKAFPPPTSQKDGKNGCQESIGWTRTSWKGGGGVGILNSTKREGGKTKTQAYARGPEGRMAASGELFVGSSFMRGERYGPCLRGERKNITIWASSQSHINTSLDALGKGKMLLCLPRVEGREKGRGPFVLWEGDFLWPFSSDGGCEISPHVAFDDWAAERKGGGGHLDGGGNGLATLPGQKGGEEKKEKRL